MKSEEESNTAHYRTGKFQQLRGQNSAVFNDTSTFHGRHHKPIHLAMITGKYYIGRLQ